MVEHSDFILCIAIYIFCHILAKCCLLSIITDNTFALFLNPYTGHGANTV